MLSALVVGSLAPDFRYFLNLAPRGHIGHSFKGIFIFCLPVGLAVLWIFQQVMKRPLISLAPRSHQQRLVPLAEPFHWGGAANINRLTIPALDPTSRMPSFKVCTVALERADTTDLTKGESNG